MDISLFNEQLLSFLRLATSPFHAVKAMCSMFEQAGYRRLAEGTPFPPECHGGYYLTREDGTCAAFYVSGPPEDGFRIIGTHSDCPSLQLKPKPDLHTASFHQLGIEVYGGPLLTTWFDRELSLAGRVNFLDTEETLCSTLTDMARPMAIIPSLAIHLDRAANNGKNINPQTDILPIIGLSGENSSPFVNLLQTLLSKQTQRKIKEILGFDLFFYDIAPPGFCGLDNEFIVGGRLDNLVSCFLAVQAMTASEPKGNTMFISTNHEEVGSLTSSGADSNLLTSLFERLLPINDCRYTALANSFFISIDNAHALHPNFKDRHDNCHNIELNNGPVIKINAKKRYATTAHSASLFRVLAKETKISTQDFVMKNDMPCGSTIGPMTAAKLGVSVVDVGIPTLAMHSIREMTGSKDPFMMWQVIRHFLTRESIPGITRCP